MSRTALCNLLYGQVCCWQCVLSKWPSFDREKTDNACPFPTPAAPTEVSSQVILTHYSKNRTWTDKPNSPQQSRWNPAIKDSLWWQKACGSVSCKSAICAGRNPQKGLRASARSILRPHYRSSCDPCVSHTSEQGVLLLAVPCWGRHAPQGCAPSSWCAAACS